jgi:Tfp pilus assembly protein PilO
MKKMPQPLAFALVGVLAVALGGAGWLVAVGPERKKAKDLAQQIDDARQQLAEASSPEIPESQRIRVADLFQLSRAMPNQPAIPDVLLQLSQTAAETGITFQSVTPVSVQATSTYQIIPIDLVFNGRFYDLSDFLYRLRNLVSVHDGTLAATGRLFSVESVGFGEGSEVQFPLVQARLRVDAYVYGISGTLPGVATAPSATSTDTTATETTTTSEPATQQAAATVAEAAP